MTPPMNYLTPQKFIETQSPPPLVRQWAYSNDASVNGSIRQPDFNNCSEDSEIHPPQSVLEQNNE